MNRGPELLGGPSPGPKNIITLGVDGLHRFPDPVAGPRVPKPHLHSQHLGLPVLALGGRPKELRASEPCYATAVKFYAYYRRCLKIMQTVAATELWATNIS